MAKGLSTCNSSSWWDELFVWLPCPAVCNSIDCSTSGFPVLHYLLEFAQVHVHWISDTIQPSHSLLPSSPVQFSSVTQLCLILCNPMDCSTPGLPVHHYLLELAQTHVHWLSDAIWPSHSLLPPSPPVLNLSQHQGLLQWVSCSHQMVKVLELQIQWTEPYKRQKDEMSCRFSKCRLSWGPCPPWVSPVRKVWRSPSPGRDVLRSSLKEEENWVGGAAAGLGSWEDRFYRERRHPLLRPTLWMRPVWPWAEGPDSWPSESEIINVPSFGFR